MKGDYAFVLECRCGEAWIFKPGTQSALDVDAKAREHLQKFPDLAPKHSLGAPRTIWSLVDFGVIVPTPAPKYVHSFDCEDEAGCGWFLEVDGDVTHTHEARVVAHREMGHHVLARRRPARVETPK